MEFNRSKINELINKFNSLGLTYLDESSHDAQTETELTNSKTEFILYCELFNELIKPLFQKIKNVHGEDIESEIIFNYFAIENDKLFLAFYEPIFYVDLDDYLNYTENIIEKLVEETEK